MGNRPSECHGVQCVWCACQLPPCTSFKDFDKWSFTSRYGDCMNAFVFNGYSAYDRKEGRGDYYRVYGQYAELDLGGENDGSPGYYLCPGCLSQQVVCYPKAKSRRYRLKLSSGDSRPSNVVSFGYEANSPKETFALAVAHTPYGNILGKAKDETCWFADWNTVDASGSEAETTRFSWIVPDDCKMFLVSPTKVCSTESLIGEGFLTSGDGGTVYFSAVACTAKYGLVPGMATFPNGRCLFSYSGKVHSTASFFYVATGEEGLEIEFRKPQAEPNTGWLSWIFTSPTPATKEAPIQEQCQVPADKIFPMSHDALGLLSLEPIAKQNALTRCIGAASKSCHELINRWDRDSLQDSPAHESGDCHIDSDQCYSEGGSRFRILRICRKVKGAGAKGSPKSIVTFASAHVEILKEPPHFGCEKIREALSSSLLSTESCGNGLRTKLYRQKLANDSVSELEKESDDNKGTYRLHSLNLSIKTYTPNDRICVHC